ncbi:MAG: alpha-N-acetylglucosaminidase TIM-barrel domain-containing protein [Verrucomicrobiae bacterium]|nr:alpha-N-acetylglucosaminidase TIM-barrel domain-containing protein [Verrucomicrobiae bacterium]
MKNKQDFSGVTGLFCHRQRIGGGFRMGIVLCGILAIVASAVIGGEKQAPSFIAAEAKKPSAVILLGKKASPVEEHAAAELAKYIHLATAARLEIKRALPDEQAGNLILLGRPETHPQIRQLAEKGAVKLSADNPGLDGYIIQTAVLGKRNCLVLGGSMDRSALYAVYDFLERFLGIGFFWEGDRIPSVDSLKIAPVEIRERPRFSRRFYLQECIYAYSTRLWNLADWAKELDWAAKKRQNTLMIPGENWNAFAKTGEIVKEAKRRGFDLVLAGECERFDRVSAEFMKDNPSHRYVKMQWGGDPFYHLLHPKDPMYLQRGKEAVRKMSAQYGDDNIFFFSPYGEQKILDASPGQIRDIRIGFADATVEILRETAPRSKWTFWTWPFVSCAWSKEDVRLFLEHMPKDMGFICDSSQPEKSRDYHYKRFNYFEGRDWLLSFIHLYGGDDYLSGNLAQLIADVNDTLRDPKAKNCCGIYICPEMIHYNTVYFDLLAKLSWNPAAVNLDVYLKDYIEKRYGKTLAPAMTTAFDCLKQAVYGPAPGMEAMYQHRVSESGFLSLYVTGMGKQLYASAPMQAGLLRRALESALSQEEAGRENECYRKDVVDIARQYLTTLFNLHLADLNRAYGVRDQKAAREELDCLCWLLDKTEEILSSYPRYQLREMFRNAVTPAERGGGEKMAKDPMLTFASNEWLIDYPSKDIYEMIKFYYRPRMELYFKAVESSLSSQTAIDEKKLLKGYRQIEKDWLAKPACGKQDIYRNENTVKVIQRMLSEAGARKGLIRDWTPMPAEELLGNQEPSWKTTGWEECFKDLSRWKVTHYEGGRFAVEDQTATLHPSARGAVVYGADVKASLKEYPVLCFQFRQPGDEQEGSAAFVLWGTWRDVSGRKWRNRIYQGEPVRYNQWTTVTLNLGQILKFVGEPSSLERLEIEVNGETTQWKFFKLGAK